MSTLALLKARHSRGDCLMQRLARRYCASNAPAKKPRQVTALQIIVQGKLGVRPVPLVRLVAHREIETLEPLFDRMAKKLVQMRASRAEPGQFSRLIARQNEVVATTELQPDAGSGNLPADIEPADVDERAHRRIVRHGQKKGTASRSEKRIVDPHLRHKG